MRYDEFKARGSHIGNGIAVRQHDRLTTILAHTPQATGTDAAGWALGVVYHSLCKIEQGDAASGA